MSTEATLEILSANSGQTENIARSLSKQLKAGDVVELISDLGGGKTTFVRGLAKGLGYAGNVTSPTFTILNQYDCGKIKVFHYDLYRLPEAGLIGQTLQETLTLPGAINIIEWPKSLNNILPKNAYKISLNFTKNNENERNVTIKADEKIIKSLRLKI